MTQFDWVLVGARFVHFAAAMALFGTTLWRLYAPPAAFPSLPSRALALLAIIALVSGALWAALTFASIGAGPSVHADLVARMGLRTGFGRAFLGQAILASALIVALVAGPRRRWVQLALSAALLAGLAFIGHSVVGEGGWGAARLANQALHLLAAGAWIGALPALWAALRTADPASAAPLVRRFSIVGMLAVCAILATGAVNTALMLGMSRAFAGSLYIRVLLAKLAMVLAMIALAAINFRSLAPRLRAGSHEALSALRRNVLAEQALALGVLAAVSWLGTLDPSM